jgi:hypothetical protein
MINTLLFVALLARPSAAAWNTRLSGGEIASGLKQALSTGVKKAVDSLGRTGGFLDAADVHIPIPDRLRSLERIARKMGMKRQADDFETTLNRAAESAVGAAADVFADALKKMTLEDARQILRGPDDAATQYFQRVARAKLAERFLPIVRKATRRVGVTRSYDSLRESAGPLMGATISAGPDLDDYVTQKALDGLFLRVAAEEKAIRRDPAARATALLKKVFGS